MSRENSEERARSRHRRQAERRTLKLGGLEAKSQLVQVTMGPAEEMRVDPGRGSTEGWDRL